MSYPSRSASLSLTVNLDDPMIIDNGLSTFCMIPSHYLSLQPQSQTWLDKVNNVDIHKNNCR
ncbi:MAG TPA: hypothetical protein VD815_04555 [Candidatus Saccharimonadales bacterium]|nr:hypothetical protein [Candidatus Saccharimonadales bacterium]